MPGRKFIFIAASDSVGQSSIGRSGAQLFRRTVFPTSLLFQGRFRNIMEMINHFHHGSFFAEAGAGLRPRLLHPHGLPALSGLLLGGYLDSNGIQCEIINHFDSESERFVRLYEQSDPAPIVGLSSTYHLSWSSLRQITSRLRAINQDMKIISGGALYPNLIAGGDAAAQWEPRMRELGLDAVFTALNSEFDLLAYLRAAADDRKLADVPNLAWFDSTGQFRVNGPVWRSPYLAAPAGNWSALNLPRASQTIQLRTAVGCPYRCSFCTFPVMSHGLHKMTEEAVSATLMEAKKNFKNLKRVAFTDDTFNSDPARFQRLCELIAAQGLQWFAYIRPQFVTRQIARHMRDCGCLGVFLGLESANQKMLDIMNKKTKIAHMAAGVEHLGREGILTHGSFFLGFPGETRTTARQTRQYILNSGLASYSIMPYTYYPSAVPESLRNHYGLQGSTNYDWRHKTMDSTEAVTLVEDIFKTVISPVAMMPSGTWHLVSMMDAGFNWAEISALQTFFNKITADQMDGRWAEPHPALADFAEVASRAKRRIENDGS